MSTQKKSHKSEIQNMWFMWRWGEWYLNFFWCIHLNCSIVLSIRICDMLDHFIFPRMTYIPDEEAQEGKKRENKAKKKKANKLIQKTNIQAHISSYIRLLNPNEIEYLVIRLHFKKKNSTRILDDVPWSFFRSAATQINSLDKLLKRFKTGYFNICLLCIERDVSKYIPFVGK